MDGRAYPSSESIQLDALAGVGHFACDLGHAAQANATVAVVSRPLVGGYASTTEATGTLPAKYAGRFVIPA